MLTEGLRQRFRARVAARPGSTLQVAVQALLGYVHEPDFAVFQTLAELPGLMLDVGAHRGQSAISVLSCTRRMRVLSFEPNPDCRASLLMLAARHPLRFRFRMAAVGSAPAESTLWLPGAAGSGLSTQAALNPAEFDKPVVRERLSAAGVDGGRRADLRQRRVRVLRLDDLGLAPDIVKIDVEGSEADVLAGLAGTLQAHRPALMVELNDGGRWLPQLHELGYGFHRYDAVGGRLAALEPPQGVVNLFALHPGSGSRISHALRQLTEPATGG